MGLNSIVYIGMRQVDSMDNTKFSSEHDCRTDTIVNQDLIFPNYMTYTRSHPVSVSAPTNSLQISVDALSQEFTLQS